MSSKQNVEFINIIFSPEIIEDYSIRTALGSFLIFIFTCGGVLLVYDAVKRLKLLYNTIYPQDNQSEISTCDIWENENVSTPEALLCIICQSRPRNMVLLACGHVVTCEACSTRLNGRCPICRQHLHNSQRIYFS